jgi:uncharacterized protein (DUF39 family)
MIISFRLSPPKKLQKFTEVIINGIHAFVGPCPNEYLGIVDLIVYGTAQSTTIKNYCGGSLFRDLAEGKQVEIIAKSSEGQNVEKTIDLKGMQFAKLLGTRQAIKNYNAMLKEKLEESRISEAQKIGDVSLVDPAVLPAAPSNLIAEQSSAIIINLHWRDNANNESGLK